MKRLTLQSGKVFYSLTFKEKIQMNALVQGGINCVEFDKWFDVLSNDESIALTRTMIDIVVCEQRYSNGKEVVFQALERTGKTLSDPLVNSLLEVAGGFSEERGFKAPLVPRRDFEEWLGSRAAADRRTVFQLCVYMFGTHEEIRRKACGPNCTHWWHQNLKDPTVVMELMLSAPTEPDQTQAQQPRKPFQIHLSTAFTAMLLVALLIHLNLSPNHTGGEIYFGWPIQYTQKSDAFKSYVDFLLAIIVVAGFIKACETWIPWSDKAAKCAGKKTVEAKSTLRRLKSAIAKHSKKG